MKKIISLLLLLSLMIGCKSTAGKNSDTKEVTQTAVIEEDMNVYFKATGNEPFWGIKMGNENFVFTSLIP